MSTKRTWEIYNYLIDNFENEFNILLKVSKEDMLRKDVDKQLVELILLNRLGELKVKPGYDGVYGEIVFGKGMEKQGKLF